MIASLCQNSAPILAQQPERGRQRTRKQPEDQSKTSSRGLKDALSRKDVRVGVQGATHGRMQNKSPIFSLNSFLGFGE